MLDEFVPWLIGSAPYVVMLTAGVGYSVLRAARNPHVYRWTIAALATALVAWGLRPILTDWPWLLDERFPDWVIVHSLASALLDLTPLALLIPALASGPQDELGPPGGENARVSDRKQHLLLPRWAWMLLAGVLVLILFQTAASLLESGNLGAILLALAGAVPGLLVLWWIRRRVLTNTADSFARTATNWTLAAWWLAWIARPVLLVGPFPIDHEHATLSILFSSLCSGLPIAMLALAALSAAAHTAERTAPARQQRSSVGQLLWLGLGGMVGAVVACVLFVVGLIVQSGLREEGTVVGAWPLELVIGIPVALLLGLLTGSVATALKLRGRLSLRRFFALGVGLYLAVLCGMFAWSTWRSPTRAAVQKHPVEHQPVIALLYELRSVQPSHMKSPPAFARSPAVIQADLDAHGTTAVPALIEALDDWQIHHLAAEQLGRLRDPRAIPPLVEFLANPRGLNPYFVNEALQQFDQESVAVAIAARERQPDAAEGRDVVESLIATLEQRDAGSYHRRSEAIQALATLGDPRAAEALYALLDDETARQQDLQRRRAADASLLRPGAAMALGRLKHERAYETLTRLVQTDENPEVRAGAIRGLQHLGDPRAVPLLSRVAAGELTPTAPEFPDNEIHWVIVQDAAQEAIRELQSR